MKYILLTFTEDMNIYLKLSETKQSNTCLT